MQDTRTPEKMGTDEVAALAEQVQEQEEILENADGLGSEYIQDKDKLRQAVRRGRRILERDSELVPKTPTERNKITAEIKRLTDLVLRDMPNKREMNYPLGTQESERAVRKNRLFHAKHNVSLLRIKHLKRCLEPDDPFAGDLESIRPN